MNLYIRLFILLFQSLFKSRHTDILTPSSLIFHVLPSDLDMNGHMNNGRYPTLMDLGRLDFIMRLGLFQLMLKQKSVPVLASVKLRFRIPLHLWESYELRTSVICWDEKWTYMEQRFIIRKGPKAGAVAAIGLVKGSFYNQKTKTTVPTDDLLAALDINEQSPVFPGFVKKWIEAEDALRNVTAV